MKALIATVIGAVLATLGFVAMRNPMWFATLAPRARGYYQRIVLDTSSRNGLRMLGVLVCLFGLVIGTAGWGGLAKNSVLQSISNGLLALLWVVFVACCAVGVILAIVQFARGKGFDWFEVWRTSAQLGEINVYPPVTPKMQREAFLFSLVFCATVLVTIIAALISR